MPTIKSRLTRLISSRRWDLAFLKEDLTDVVNGKKIHCLPIKNPYSKEYWFADPFILESTEDCVSILAEAMPRCEGSKASIALLTIDRKALTIINMEIVLEENWHLSFPCIVRKNGKVYVCPESAEAEHLYAYELTRDDKGRVSLKRIKSICDEVIWDSDITEFFGETKMFTAHKNNYQLDVYSLDHTSDKFIYEQSVMSEKPNMRLAGSLFRVNDTIYCPQQDNKYTYGNAVEINKIDISKGTYHLTPCTVICPPKGIMADGLHTFNSYNGLIVVDILIEENILSYFARKLVRLKKGINAFLKAR